MIYEFPYDTVSVLLISDTENPHDWSNYQSNQGKDELIDRNCSLCSGNFIYLTFIFGFSLQKRRKNVKSIHWCLKKNSSDYLSSLIILSNHPDKK